MMTEEREKAKNVINELKLYAEDLQYHSADEMKEALDMITKALEQQTCEDCISRTELLAKIDAERKHLLDLKMDGAEHIVVHHARRIVEEMPSVTPKTDLFDKQIIKDWLSTFNTDSATACFTAVQELKKEINNERSNLRNY